jgi:CDP-6-deoxy-D-xylo-4-hexulose-3-dehydrase
MVSSNIKEIVDLARSFAWWGRDCYCVGSQNLLSCGTCGKRFDTWLTGYDKIVDHKYVFGQIGYNLKPIDMLGSIGSIQLKNLMKYIKNVDPIKKNCIKYLRLFLVFV